MRFVLFKGQSQYGSLRLHIDQLGAALVALDHEVQVLDLVHPEADAALRTTFHSPPDCYLGMGGVGADVRTGTGQSIYDVLGVSYVQMHVDNPVHHPGRLTTPIKRNIAFFLDQSHVQFVEAWPAATPSQTLFLPPGANEGPEPADVSDEAFAKRDIPILFTGTYRGAPAMPWRDYPEGPLRLVLNSVAGRMASDASLAILDALRAVLTDFSVDLTPELMDQFAPELSGVQFFTEAYHRNALLGTLAADGVPVLAYGRGWERLVERHPSFSHGGVGSFEETLGLLRRAKIVLNTNNGFVAGGHERVFSAMSGGAAVFSDASKYYLEAFKSGEEISLFEWSDLASVPAQLGRLLSDDAGLAAIARAGHARVQAEHTWTTRAHTIVEAVKRAV